MRGEIVTNDKEIKARLKDMSLEELVEIYNKEKHEEYFTFICVAFGYVTNEIYERDPELAKKLEEKYQSWWERFNPSLKLNGNGDWNEDVVFLQEV